MDREHLDKQIAALTLVLCNLRTQRNRLSPISSLPPEILGCIFIHCARGCQRNRYFAPDIPDWVNVSYVCRHWRHVALNCPTLWSFLFVSSHNWTTELLVRSKEAPLKVCTDSEYPKQSKELYLLEKVAPETHRIQDLCLRLTRREAERILSMFTSRAPLLRTLQVWVEKSNHLEEPPEVSRALFDGDTPALRKLELKNFTFPLTSPRLCNLESLRLRDLPASFQPTLAELQLALSHMRNLAHLHLENALPSALGSVADGSLGGSEKLIFPQLSRLSVVAPFSTVILLLSHLDLPLKTEVRLRCCFEAGSEDYTPICPLLIKRFAVFEDQATAHVPVIRSCSIQTIFSTVGFIFSRVERDSGRRAFSADTTSYELGQLHGDWDCNIPLKVDIVLRTSLPSDREELIRKLCRSMPLTNLQSVQLDFDTGTALSSDFWFETFGHLDELRHIKLSRANPQGLVQVLSPSSHHPARKDGGSLKLHSGPTLVPALEELELHDVDFSKVCYGRQQGNPANCSCSVQCLYDALFNRLVDGHGLRRLVFAECMYVHGYDVKGFRGLVTDTEWDGITRTCPEPTNTQDDEDEYQRRRRHFGMIHDYRIVR